MNGTEVGNVAEVLLFELSLLKGLQGADHYKTQLAGDQAHNTAKTPELTEEARDIP